MEDQDKTHWEKYRIYYLCGIAVVVGVGAGLLIARNINFYNTKITAGNDVNIFTTELARRGHPGWVTRCLETGELYASQNRAAACNNVSRSMLSSHLNGVAPDAGGLHFERVAVAQ